MILWKSNSVEWIQFRCYAIVMWSRMMKNIALLEDEFENAITYGTDIYFDYSDSVLEKVIHVLQTDYLKPIFVLTESIGEMIFVASSVPPRPTSNKAISTPCSIKVHHRNKHFYFKLRKLICHPVIHITIGISYNSCFINRFIIHSNNI